MREKTVLLLLVGLSSAGCGGAEGYEEGSEVAATTEPIINGSTNLMAYDNERLRTMLLVNQGVGACTATLLRRTVVLTARHCVNATGTLLGNLQTPSKITVNGVPAVEFFVSSSNVDAALVFFGSGLVNYWDDFTAIDPYKSAKHVGLSEVITGFGSDASGVAALRVGTVIPYAVDAVFNPPEGGTTLVTLTENRTNGTSIGPGDSGGPRWGESTIYPRPVAGVASSSEGGAFGDSRFAQAAEFRYEFRSSIFEHVDPSIDLGFDSTAELPDNFVPLQAVSGTACNWQVQGSALVQTSNAPQCFQIQRGAFENFTASMYVQAADDDTVGIAFRYVSKDNHFRCETSASFVQLVRRLNGVDRVLVTASRSGAMDGVLSVNSTENRHTCSFGNRTVSVTSSNFAIGKVAIYNHYNKGAKILWWQSMQEVPVNRTW